MRRNPMRRSAASKTSACPSATWARGKRSKARKAAAKVGDAPNSRHTPKMRIEPFSFIGWEDAALTPPLTTAETKAADCEESAKRETSIGSPEQAKTCRKNAGSWRKLAAVPEADIKRHDWHFCEDLMEGVDFLLVRGQKSREASVYLSMIIDRALKGLHALAAHGNETAASLLVTSLTKGATNFELLAYHKPKIFLPTARKRLQIPATISPRSGKAKENKELCDKLQVGTEAAFAIAHRGKGKRWSATSEANSLAVRLVNYIDHFSWLSKTHADHLEVFETYPEWFPCLANLAPFGKVTWKAWADVAWEIIEDISPQRKPEKHPAFHSPETKICNVRKGAHNDDATARADIKEALFGAFETVATGVSPRTRQRQSKASRQKR
jgi:hypothetical protein